VIEYNKSVSHRSWPLAGQAPDSDRIAEAPRVQFFLSSQHRHTMASTQRPIVFMDINIGETPAGRLKMELFSDVVPKYVVWVPPYIRHRLAPFSGLPRISVSYARESTGSTRDRRVIKVLRSIGEPSPEPTPRTVSHLLTSQMPVECERILRVHW
jgi:hypothetical protein